MQTRSQTIAELRKENEMLKLMIFGGELGKGSSFSSVGFVEQLERKDAQIEDMEERHGARRSLERVGAQKELDGLKEEYKELRRQDYIDYLEMCKVAVNRGQENKKLEEEKKSLTFIMKGQDDVREECIKGWRKQVEELKEEIAHKNNKFSEWIEEIKKLKEEAEQLKDDYHQKGIDEQTEIEEHEASREQIEELKEEISDWAKKRARWAAAKAVAEARAQELKDENKKLTISFWRMCEDLADFRAVGVTTLVSSDAGWLEQMKAMIEDRKGEIDDEGDLFEGYKQWIDRVHGDHE